MAKEILPSESLPGELPPSESAFDVVVTAGLVVAAYNVWRMVNCSLKYCRREHLNNYYNNYGKFENFIDKIGLEIKEKFDEIKTLTEEVKNAASIEINQSKAFIDDQWMDVRMIEMEMEECKKKIAFARDKTREFAHSLDNDGNRDTVSIVMSNVATVLTSFAYVAFGLPLRIAVGAITLGNVINSVCQYWSRKNERVDFRSNLSQKNADFDQMRSEMERRLQVVTDSLKMFRKPV